MPVIHAKTDNKSDWTQQQLNEQIAAGNFSPGTLLADIVLPSDWNAGHVVNVNLSTETTGILPVTAMPFQDTVSYSYYGGL